MINREPNLIPNNKIICFAEDPSNYAHISTIVEHLKGNVKRDCFSKHAYYCLPIVIGNQYGFAIKSTRSFTAEWNGGEASFDTKIKFDDSDIDTGSQIVNSHFGTGIITVQNRFNFRTPLGVNLMVMNAPNYFHYNLQSLFAVVEADNLRRDFTFNLKIVKPNIPVEVKAGDVISAILPIPRFFVDNFSINSAPELFSQEVIDQELAQLPLFSEQRSGADLKKPHGAGKLYHSGVDASGNTFFKHQKTLLNNQDQ